MSSYSLLDQIPGTDDVAHKGRHDLRWGPAIASIRSTRGGMESWRLGCSQTLVCVQHDYSRLPETSLIAINFQQNMLVSSTKAKPDASDGVDERIGLLAVDLAADPSDVDIDDVGGRVKMQIPYMLKQHRPRHHVAFVANEIFEHLEFPRQQVDAATAAARGARYQVEREIADPQHRFLHDSGAAARQGVDPRKQLGEGERLDEVVVAAGAQAAHPVVYLAECADDERRCGDAAFPQAADDRNAVEARQHAIDHHHRIFSGASARQTVIAVHGEIDLIAVRGEGLHELPGRFRIVFYDKNAAETSHHDVAPPVIAMITSILSSKRCPNTDFSVRNWRISHLPAQGPERCCNALRWRGSDVKMALTASFLSVSRSDPGENSDVPTFHGVVQRSEERRVGKECR